jgi:arylsulfatase A-like enzyme
MRFYENNRLELYNLETDLGETQNLAQKRPEKRKEMVGRLDAWLKRTDAPIPRRKED